MKKSNEETMVDKTHSELGFNYCLIVLLLIIQILVPYTVEAYSNFSESSIESEVNNNASFQPIISNEIQFKRDPYINDVDSQAEQSIESFYTRLLTSSISSLPSEPGKKWIPVVGSQIIFLPEEVTLYPLVKRIGDKFVQERLVRSQIYNLLGRHLLSGIYSTEAAQIDALYNNSYELVNKPGFNKKLGEQLTQEEVNQFGLDVIWPEVWNVNGQDNLVPVLHLSEQTIEDQLVGGHVVEFIGDGAEFNNILIESGSITTRRNALLQVTENFIIGEGATVTAEGDLNLSVGGTLLNHGHLTAEQSINILAGNYYQKTLVHRFHTTYGQGDRLGKISSITAGENITIRSMSDIVILGAEAYAGNDISFDAFGNITIGSVQLSWQSSNSLENYQHQISRVEHVRSILSAGDNISLMANGLININASTLHAEQGHIDLLAGLGISIINETNQQQSYTHYESSNMTIDESSYVTVAMRAVLDSGQGIRIHSTSGDITLQAVDITSSTGTSVRADSGGINMLMTIENDQYNYDSVREKLWTITTISRGHDFETAVPNTVIGGFKTEALYGVKVQYEGDASLSLEEQVLQTSTLPGMEWMAEMWNIIDPAEFEVMELEYREWNDKTTQLSPAAMALISMAAAMIVGPHALEFAEGLAGTGAAASSIEAAIASGLTSLSSQAAVAGANGLVNGDFAEAMKVFLTSEDTWKSIATAMITAGAIKAVNAKFFEPAEADIQALAEGRSLGNVVPGSDLFNKLKKELSALTFTEQAVQVLTHTTIRASLSNIVYGTDFEDTFKQSLIQTGINKIGNEMQEVIGEAFDVENEHAMNTALRYIAHAGVSCVIGAASVANENENDDALNNACSSAAGGSIIGLFIGDILTTDKQEELELKQLDWLAEHGVSSQADLMSLSQQEFGNLVIELPTYDLKEIQALKVSGVNISMLTSGLIALISGGDVNLSANAARDSTNYGVLNTFRQSIEAINALEDFLNLEELVNVHSQLELAGDDIELISNILSELSDKEGFEYLKEMSDSDRVLAVIDLVKTSGHYNELGEIFSVAHLALNPNYFELEEDSVDIQQHYEDLLADQDPGIKIIVGPWLQALTGKTHTTSIAWAEYQKIRVLIEDPLIRAAVDRYVGYLYAPPQIVFNELSSAISAPVDMAAFTANSISQSVEMQRHTIDFILYEITGDHDFSEGSIAFQENIIELKKAVNNLANLPSVAAEEFFLELEATDILEAEGNYALAAKRRTMLIYNTISAVSGKVGLTFAVKNGVSKYVKRAKNDLGFDDIPTTYLPNDLELNLNDSQRLGLEVDDVLDFDEGIQMKTDLEESFLDLYNDAELLKKVTDMLESGLNLPITVTVYEGEQLYLIVPSGDEPTELSSQFLTFDSVSELPMDPNEIANSLGLPQAASSYDIYGITASVDVEVYQSVVAPYSVNNGTYIRNGGVVQVQVTRKDLFSEITLVQPNFSLNSN